MVTFKCYVHVNNEWDIVHGGYLDLDLSTGIQSLMQLSNLLLMLRPLNSSARNMHELNKCHYEMQLVM